MKHVRIIRIISFCVAVVSLTFVGLADSVNAYSDAFDEQVGDLADNATVLQQTVTGTVTDAQTGEPLPGVSILIQGTGQGAATDFEGDYSLEVPGPDAVLVFSFIGYGSQEITVGDRESIDVTLEPVALRMDEMVVVGYGTVQRRDLTGSVDRIDAEQFRDQSITDVSEMLTGTIAGFNANQSSSASGGASFEIRGPNSLTAGTTPLIVLDGVIYRGSLRDINPADIESVDILKDASSAAVYGARAASGVVLITTTKGHIGRPTVNFSSKIGRVETTTDHYKFQGPDEYIAFRQNYFRGQHLGRPNWYWNKPDNLPEGVTVQDWRAQDENPLPDDTREWMSRMNFFPLEMEMYEKYLATGEYLDWGDLVYPTGLRQEADLSIAGGTENARYYWSVGYVDNEGVRLGDQFSAIRTRLNVDFDVVDWLSGGVNVQYSDRDESTIPASRGQTHNSSPFARLYDEDGNPEWAPHGYAVAPSPVINTLAAERDRKINNLFGSLYLEAVLPFEINLRTSVQPRYQSLRDYQFWGTNTRTGGESVSGGRADRRDFSRFDWMLTNMVTWDREFGIHRFNVTLVHEAEENREWDSFQRNTTFLPSPALGYHGLQFGTNPTLETEDERTTGDAMLARLNYNLLGRYLFTASIRRDGYSAFGQENPRATFPAGAFAWQISDESFFDVDMINNLKLRLSWGVNGNRDIGAYSSLSQLGSRLYYDGTRVNVGVTTSTLANRGLMWEQTEAFNLGLDIGLLENRIDLTLDYYDMTTTNLLVDRSLPMLTGFENVTTNIGELGNKGFEMTLRTVNVTSQNLNWRSTLNFSLNRNEIKSLFGEFGTYRLLGQDFEGEVPDFDNQWFPGRSIDAVWDYDITGMWQMEEVDEAAAYGLQPGDIKARDVDGNGTYEALDDKVFIGHTEPRFRIGFRNQVDFLQNFSASIFIRADLGHIRPFPDAIHRHSTYDRRNESPTPYWTEENRSNEWPRTAQLDGPYGGGVMMYKDASFVRIQDFMLSYTLPSALTQQLQLQNLRIYGSVRNLYSFDNWPGWDPESWTSGGTNIELPRTFTLGLNLSI